MALSKGYQCEFIDQVNDLFYCNKCSVVARRLTVTGCCGESYCHACIVDICQQGKPCPDCGKKRFTIYEQLKYQHRIRSIQAYCTLRKTGCGWSGTLEQLDTHLDPDQDSCQYVDTKCPLNCHMTIPKNKVEQHVAEECTKRPYVCQHCGFKATYEEVLGTHLSECKYVPLQCPNRCGVTCDREDMEDHMKMCRLQEVACEFQGVGCSEKNLREDESDHAEMYTQKHLAMTAAEAIKSRNQLEQDLEDRKQITKEWGLKLQEQEQKLHEQEQKLQEQEQKLQEQEQKLQEQEQKLQEQEQKLREQEQKLQKQEQKLQKQEQKLQKQEQKLQKQEQKMQKMQQKLQGLEKSLLKQNEEMAIVKENMDKLTRNVGHFVNCSRTFEIRNLMAYKVTCYGPDMYTNVSGYKFCLGASVSDVFCSVNLRLVSRPGEFDDQLKWPAQVTFTLLLLNQKGGQDMECTQECIQWNRPSIPHACITAFKSVEKSELNDFLHDDTLYFNFVKLVVE